MNHKLTQSPLMTLFSSAVAVNDTAASKSRFTATGTNLEKDCVGADEPSSIKFVDHVLAPSF